VLRRHSSWIAAVAIACGDNVTGPATRELTLSVCPINSWVAYQNEGAAWKRLGGSTGGDVTIKATDRFALAVSNTITQSPVLRLYFINADQAQAVLACFESNPYATRSISGTVQGIASSLFTELSIGRSTALLDVNSTSFAFGYAAAGTRDLFAMRTVLTGNDGHVDRIIIRRAQAHADGTVPLLDFESSEAIPPAQNVLSWTASGAHVQVNFRGADGNPHTLQSIVVGANGGPVVPRTTALYSVPADRQVAGDLHELMLFNEDRNVTRYYQQPSDMTLTLGPALLEPAFLQVGTTPSMHAVLPWQPEYDGSVFMFLHQPGLALGSVNVTITREHVLAGGASPPAAWGAILPDLRSVDGFPSGVGIVAGAPFEWSVFATSRPWEAVQTLGAAGDVFRSAARYGTAGN